MDICYKKIRSTVEEKERITKRGTERTIRERDRERKKKRGKMGKEWKGLRHIKFKEMEIWEREREHLWLMYCFNTNKTG